MVLQELLQTFMESRQDLSHWWKWAVWGLAVLSKPVGTEAAGDWSEELYPFVGAALPFWDCCQSCPSVIRSSVFLCLVVSLLWLVSVCFGSSCASSLAPPCSLPTCLAPIPQLLLVHVQFCIPKVQSKAFSPVILKCCQPCL